MRRSDMACRQPRNVREPLIAERRQQYGSADTLNRRIAPAPPTIRRVHAARFEFPANRQLRKPGSPGPTTGGSAHRRCRQRNTGAEPHRHGSNRHTPREEPGAGEPIQVDRFGNRSRIECSVFLEEPASENRHGSVASIWLHGDRMPRRRRIRSSLFRRRSFFHRSLQQSQQLRHVFLQRMMSYRIFAGSQS